MQHLQSPGGFDPKSTDAAMRSAATDAPPMRSVDKVATWIVKAVSVTALAVIVIAAALVGIPIPGTSLSIHSVWIAVVIGIVLVGSLEFIVRWWLGLLGIRVRSMFHDLWAEVFNRGKPAKAPAPSDATPPESNDSQQG